jgi:hypothetical protein
MCGFLPTSWLYRHAQLALTFFLPLATVRASRETKNKARQAVGMIAYRVGTDSP